MAKSMTKTFLAAGTLALAVAGSSRAFGHGMGGGDACGHGGLAGGRRVLHALDLSADQKQGVHDILREHRPTLAQLGATQKKARQAPTSCSARAPSRKTTSTCWCSRNRRPVPP